MLPTSLEVLDLSGGEYTPHKFTGCESDYDDDDVRHDDALMHRMGINTNSPHKFTGGIPSEWGALTNLKELKMAYCGLDGKPLSTRSERFSFRVDMVTFFCRTIA